MKTHTFTIKESELIEYKKKAQARKLLANSVKKGETMRADCCDLCQVPYLTIAHHTDYGKPLDVIWVCNECHGVVHRKEHPLNPVNVKQTHIPLFWNCKDSVSVTFQMPVEHYLALRKLSEKTGLSCSKLIRDCVKEHYPVDSNQLQFLFMDNKDERNTRLPERVSLLEYTEECLPKQESPKIYSVWVKGVNVGERMEQLSNVYFANGTNAAGMRWTYSHRKDAQTVLPVQLQMGKSTKRTASELQG